MSASDTEAAVKPLEANELPISKIFSSDYAFEIPPYQRPYSWTEKEAGKLLEDLMDAVGDVREVQEAPSYFLGSIVLIKGQGSPAAEIVDGQQRLTTLTILLAILRDMTQNETDRADLQSFIFQEKSDIRAEPELFRLKLRRKDQDYFKNNIQKSGSTSKLCADPQNGLTLN